MRRVSKKIRVGNVFIGGDAPVPVQSMLSVPAGDVAANVAQAKRLEACGCAIIRVSVPTLEDVRLVPAIKAAVDIPLVADIHFDHRIALAALAAGADKIRINPGNIGSEAKIQQVADACRERGVPIRIGVNGGSLDKTVLDKYAAANSDALFESAKSNIDILEKYKFDDIVVSVKSSHVPTMVEAVRKLCDYREYPIHLGATEAGTYRSGIVKNAVGIGTLLLEGIGDTLRVSLTDEPENEVLVGYDILRAAGLPVAGAEVISCPTCGRTNIPVAEIAREVEHRLAGCKKNIKVAVMGCVVNGIGEGKEADIGIAGGVDSAVLFVKGEKKRVLHGDYVQALLEEIERL
ncbi:MAG: flavodoxin-dependent (E)-4-hydroxy-3-methylbut-2-enyl-diphosphate synthase [Oscillospiraceae bacterium]